MNDATIYARILEYREKLGISESDMAAAVGLPFTMYRVFEQTPSKFTNGGYIEKCADKLGITPEELLAD